jgi:hypothetical protein
MRNRVFRQTSYRYATPVSFATPYFQCSLRCGSGSAPRQSDANPATLDYRTDLPGLQESLDGSIVSLYDSRVSRHIFTVYILSLRLFASMRILLMT